MKDNEFIGVVILVSLLVSIGVYMFNFVGVDSISNYFTEPTCNGKDITKIANNFLVKTSRVDGYNECEWSWDKTDNGWKVKCDWKPRDWSAECNIDTDCSVTCYGGFGSE